MTASSWLPWALLSAFFAALTAIFAKVAAMFLGERPGMREWLGIALVGHGVLLPSLRR